MTISLGRFKRLGNLKGFGKVPFHLNLENQNGENIQTFRQLFRILPSGPNQLEDWRQMDKIRTFRICEKMKTFKLLVTYYEPFRMIQISWKVDGKWVTYNPFVCAKK